MSKRCYVLGAGFSKPFGLPLARELTQMVIEDMAAEESPGLAQFIAPALRAWSDFLKHLYPSCDFKTTWPDFEDMITVLDEWEEYRATLQDTPIPEDPFQPAHIKNVLLKHLGILLCQRTPGRDDCGFGVVRKFVSATAQGGHSVIRVRHRITASFFMILFCVSYCSGEWCNSNHHANRHA